MKDMQENQNAKPAPVHPFVMWWVKESFRWWWRIDWEMIEFEKGPWEPGQPVSKLNPYFIETWKDKRTGEIRIHEST